MALYDKLSEENKELLQKAITSFPGIHLQILESLKLEDYPGELALKDAANLWWAIYPTKVFDLTGLYKFFDNDY
jgi:hypothetical protein